jgi:predicted nucleic acid-binding protein
MFTVLLDTNVLFPSYLRDTLLTLADGDLYRPLWSEGVLVELHRNLITKANLTERVVERLLDQMRSAFPEAEVTGYEPIIDQMDCDLKDRHVLAAAVVGRAEAIVTFDLSDFPPLDFSPHGIAPIDPDNFLLDLLDLAPGAVLRALGDQAAKYKRHPKTVHGLLEALAVAGAPRFADEVRRLLA